MAANGLSIAARPADSEEVNGAATRPKERSNGVNDNAKDGEEAGDDATCVCLRKKSGWLGFFFKIKGKIAHSLNIIAAPESSGVALACWRGWTWRVLETTVRSRQLSVSRH